jgi:hypothetical protein
MSFWHLGQIIASQSAGVPWLPNSHRTISHMRIQPNIEFALMSQAMGGELTLQARFG